jgi:hypothetical protein
MSWTQYEVWTETDGHQELVETTHSEREAIDLARETYAAGEVDLVLVYEESDNGEYREIYIYPELEEE